MLSAILKTVALAAVALPLSLAQTFTSCDPTNKTCPADPALSTARFTSDFTTGSSAGWTTTAGSVKYGARGAEFTINQRGDAPTIQTNFHVFFGYVEVKMRASSGTGIVSSLVLESDDLDEVDWEFLGGNNAQVQTNYFGKGNTTTYDRMIPYNVADTQGTTHTYAVNWTSSALTWLIDGVAVRTLPYAAANGGANFPQTPMNVRIGIWAGGDPSNQKGTIQWAGGETDYSKTPYTMYVESVKVTNYNPACQYTYGDRSGSWQSIRMDESCGNSTSALISATGSTRSAASTIAAAVSGATPATSRVAAIPTALIPPAVISSSATGGASSPTNGTAPSYVFPYGGKTSTVPAASATAGVTSNSTLAEGADSGASVGSVSSATTDAAAGTTAAAGADTADSAATTVVVTSTTTTCSTTDAGSQTALPADTNTASSGVVAWTSASDVPTSAGSAASTYGVGSASSTFALGATGSASPSAPIAQFTGAAARVGSGSVIGAAAMGVAVAVGLM